MMITGVHGRFIARKCPPPGSAASTELVDPVVADGVGTRHPFIGSAGPRH
jgi:hypothetical protein